MQSIECEPMLPVDRIKVKYAKIFATKFKNNRDGILYYQIEYHDVSDNAIKIGFGAFGVQYVHQWLQDCFEFSA